MPRPRMSAAQFDTDEEEAQPETSPRPRRRRAAAEEDSPLPARSTGERPDREEEDDADYSVIPISRGRKAINQSRPNGDGSDAYFRWNEEPQVVKFLSNEPWSYNQHWVTREGKQSFPCIGKGCPLCGIGVKSTQKIVYAIMNFSLEIPVVQTLEVGITLDESLDNFDSDKKTGPLDRMWWALSRSKGSRSTGRAKYNYTITPVKDRDLTDDWGIDLDEALDMLEDAEVPGISDVLGKWTKSALQEIADEAMA